MSDARLDFPYGSLAALTDVAIFKRAYVSANGTSAMLESAQTIRVKGTMQTGGKGLPFVLFKKQPDLLLFTADQGSFDMTVGVSGDNVWQRISAPARDEIVTLNPHPRRLRRRKANSYQSTFNIKLPLSL